MKYISVGDAAKKWNVSERSARDYCLNARIPGVIREGKSWKIPEDARKPQRKKAGRKSINRFINKIKAGKGLCDFRRNIS